MIYGYARVSTDGQSVQAQRAALIAAGCEKVFSEVASGGKSDRRQLERALKALAPGDVFVVTSMDRLARSTRDLLNVLVKITRDQGAAFRSLAEPWAGTSDSPHGALMVTIYAAFAEFERAVIVARTGAGRRRAKAGGRKMGPKYKLSPDQRKWVAEERARHDGPSCSELAERLNVSKATIGRVKPAAPASVSADQDNGHGDGVGLAHEAPAHDL
jgi:DNA invertase Pin-like site-specific DNA recombinase